MGRDLEPSVVKAMREQLQAGRSAAQIAADMRLRQCVVQKYRREFLAQEPEPKCGCGRPSGHPGICAARRVHLHPDSGRRLEPSVVEALHEMIMSGLTQRQIVERLQVANTTVSRHRAMLAARGPLPPCPCGKPLGHYGMCPARNRQVRVRIAGAPARADEARG